MNRRVVILALVVTLAIRLAAWGVPVQGAVHLSDLNQTIPTATPTGGASTATPSQPTATSQPTYTATQSPGVPSDTPTATSSGLSETPTKTPTSGAATATGSTTASPSPTTSAFAEGQTPSPADTVSATAPALATLGATETTYPAVESSDVPVTAAATPVQTQPADGGTASTSCLWIVLGLLLIIAGAVFLIRGRRAGREA